MRLSGHAHLDAFAKSLQEAMRLGRQRERRPDFAHGPGGVSAESMDLKVYGARAGRL